MAEYDVCDGFTLQHYDRDDWFPVVDARWWVREWLMCDEECEVEVTSRDDNRAEWGMVQRDLQRLGNVGPYGEEPVFSALTYNSENDLSDELLIAAGWVDVGEQWATRGLETDLLEQIRRHHGADWDEIGRVWVVAIARGGCYGHTDAIADVYVDPNMDDDYDVARWQVQLIASETGGRGSHPIHDACGGFGDRIEGLTGTGYPYGRDTDDQMPMWDVSDIDDDTATEIRDHAGAWLAIGDAGVFAIGTDGRVHEVGAWVN